MKITKGEIRRRTGYIMLGFFTYYLVEPVQMWVDTNLHLNPFMIGIGGIILTLYIFDF